MLVIGKSPMIQCNKLCLGVVFALIEPAKEISQDGEKVKKHFRMSSRNNSGRLREYKSETTKLIKTDSSCGFSMTFPFFCTI